MGERSVKGKNQFRRVSKRWCLVGAWVAVSLVGWLHEGRAAASLPRGAYIWQREWNAGLREAVRQNRAVFAEWVVLVAEIEFREGTPPQLAVVSPDYECLLQSGRPVGLALRVGPYAGSFDAGRPESELLCRVAREVLAGARRQGIEPTQLQLDFDAATRQLGGYRDWLVAVRGVVAPVPLVLTVLPTWLDSPEFVHLIEAADRFVLQVHSWEPPRAPDQEYRLCDPRQVRDALLKAQRCKRPFWLALPTYGYRAWFDGQNRLVKLAAEGPELVEIDGLTVREVRADPVELAGLVRSLDAQPPGHLQGILWYRLPHPEDRLNWHWRTLQAVVQGCEPQAKTDLALESSADGLVELTARAAGEADSLIETPISLAWKDARLLAADGLLGFAAVRLDPQTISFVPAPGRPLRLAPGKTLTIGWLRFDRTPEVSIHEKSAATR